MIRVFLNANKYLFGTEYGQHCSTDGRPKKEKYTCFIASERMECTGMN